MTSAVISLNNLNVLQSREDFIKKILTGKSLPLGLLFQRDIFQLELLTETQPSLRVGAKKGHYSYISKKQVHNMHQIKV